MENNSKVVAIFSDTVTESALKEIFKKHSGLVHDFSNEEEFKAARKVNTEMNKLIKEVDRVGIDAAKQVTEKRNELKSKIESAYAGTVTPFKIEDQKRKDEEKRIKAEKEAIIAAQRDTLAMIRGASARAIHLPIDDIEDILQDVMGVDLSKFEGEMLAEAKIAKEISLAQLKDAFKYATEKEESRRKAEIKEAELADKNDEIAALKAQLEALSPNKPANEAEKERTLYDAISDWANNHEIENHLFVDLVDTVSEYTSIYITKK